MAAARMPGAPHRARRPERTCAAGRGEAGARRLGKRHRGPCFETARETRRRRRHPQPARPGISPGRSEGPVSASISRQLVLWLAGPLMLVALCGALVHYFNNVAPSMLSSDRRLKDASNALMARAQVIGGHWSLDARA